MGSIDPGVANVSNCPFCYENAKADIIAENETAFAISDRFPVTEGHILIISKRHVPDPLALTPKERHEIENLMIRLWEEMQADDPFVTGCNIGVNCGKSAGQTIFHVHYHLIPRRDGDTEHPRGGVRGVIPGKRAY
jgi:diadenosine tetraphosphate (Ap4A) HIT family hydrolase